MRILNLKIRNVISLKLTAFLLFAVMCVACEEEESPILFDTTSNSNPENIKCEYYSPDPNCVEKMYWITALSEAGEITLKCTNRSNISIANNQPESSDDYYYSTVGAWSASVSDGTCLKIRFEAAGPDVDDPYTVDYIKVVSKTKKGTVSTSIQVMRSLID